MSVMAIMVVGISCFVIPEAKTVSSLIIPHFCLGLGIGILDTSLVPYLARLADTITSNSDDSSVTSETAASNYGSVYAIQQTAVSLAYSIGERKEIWWLKNLQQVILSVPFLGGELAQSLGFPAIMRVLGIMNFIYGPVLLFVTMKYNLNVSS